MASWLRRLSRRIADWLAEQAGPNGAYGAGLHYLRRGKPEVAEVAFRDAQRLWEATAGGLGHTHACHSKAERHATGQRACVER